MKRKFNTLKFRKAVFITCVLTITTAAFTSCKKFLDTPQNSKTSLVTTVKDCQAILDNSNMYQQYPADGHISSDDYYLADAEYDAVDETTRGLYSWLPTAQRLKDAGSSDWLSAYTNVKYVNVTLESLIEIEGKNPAVVSADDYKLAKGMALFLRANNFYQIAVEYAKAYAPGSSNQDPGIPLRLTSDINVPSSRGTVQQTYDQIIKDLQEAVSLLPNTTRVPTRPDKAAAYALLARVYLAMGEYTLAGAAANSSIQLKGELMNYDAISDADKDSDAPFRHFNKEVLYHSTIVTPIVVYFAKVNPLVMGSYTDPNDLRKRIFFKEIAPDTYSFKGGYNENAYAYFNGLTVDEMYLVRAECYARADNIGAAVTDLNKLLRNRWKTGTYSDFPAGSKSVVLDKILAERRKELIFRVQRWSDLKRLNKTTAVTLSRTVKGTVYTLPPDDLRYQLLLPQDVIEFGGLPQNPR